MYNSNGFEYVNKTRKKLLFVMVFVAALFVAVLSGTFAYFRANVTTNNNVTDIPKDYSIIIFLNYDATKEDVASVENVIKSTGNVESLTFVSKQETAQKYLEENSVFATVIEGWTDDTNPLADTFVLKVKDINKIKTTGNTIKKSDKVMRIYY